MGWKAPKTKEGKPCKRCKPGKWCHHHRQKKAKPRIRGKHGSKSKSRRGSYKLNRAVIKAVKEALESGARTEADLCRAAGVAAPTWISWRDQGIDDADNERTTLFRELWEITFLTRRAIALEADEAVLAAALGHKKVIRDKNGKAIGVYETSPDGRLAMEYVRANDPGRYHNPRHDVHHEGEVQGPTPIIHINADPQAILKAAESEKRRRKQ